MGIIMRFRIIISTLLLITIGANQAWSDVDIKVQTQQYIQKGKDYYHQHKYKEAVDEYLKAYKLDPSNPELWELLGYSELKQGHIQNAVGDLEQSIERDPNFVMGHYNLALAYWAQGRKEDAVQQMQKVVDLNLSMKKAMEEDSQFKKLIKFIGQSEWDQKQFYVESDEKWFKEIEPIWRGFSSGGLNPEEIEILNHQLRYESSIISEIVKLNSMIRDLRHLGDESAQLVTNGSVESDPHSADDINAEYNKKNKECVLESHRLGEVLGDKEPEFREWLEEEQFIGFKACGGWMGTGRKAFESASPNALAQELVDSFQQQKKLIFSPEQINNFKKRVIFWFCRCNPQMNGTIQDTKSAQEDYKNAYQDAINN
jgi:hypothetical protein